MRDRGLARVGTADLRTPGRRRGTECNGHVRAPAVKHKSREYVNEHAIANERAHRVAARKAPAHVSEERGRVFGARAADHELEDLIEDAASREGGDPTAEDDPLAADREE